MTSQISITRRALKDELNPDQTLLRTPATLMGPEGLFHLYVGPSAPSQTMSGPWQSPAWPQTCPCLAMEPHNLKLNPWTLKYCCSLIVNLGLLGQWIDGRRAMVSDCETTNPPHGPAFPCVLISLHCWLFTQPQALKLIPLSHSGLWGLSGGLKSPVP